MRSGNLLAGIAHRSTSEVCDVLLASEAVAVERIVSTGQATPPGEWLDQERDEWVILVQGGAGLRFEGEAAARVLRPGDWVHIPAHHRHRVEWTDGRAPTVWLAVHLRR